MARDSACGFLLIGDRHRVHSRIAEALANRRAGGTIMQFKKILVPLDFSEPSKRALDCGLALATRLKAKLVVAHIVPEASVSTYPFPIESPSIETGQREKRAAQEIQALIPEQRAKLLDLQIIVKVGLIEEDLLQIINEQSVDLVIMGSHGRRSFRRWFLGSVTEHILRRVPVPILTVSHIEEAKYPFGGVTAFKRLLYAADLGESSVAGMQYATQLAQQFSAELTVMTVVEYLNLSYEAAAHLVNEHAERRERTQTQLDAFVARHKPNDMQVKTLVVDGKAYERILSTADELNVDCIVLNLQSKGLLERAFLGSTAERVVRSATIPVFSVPFASPS
jgi:nucleotide-binding universal stress UspA family protein